MYTLSLVFALLALLNITAAVPIPKPGLVRRANVTTPLGLGADTGGDIPALANGIGEFSPIEDGFLEGDSDSGDGNDNGSSGSSVANGLGSVGSASESNTDTSSGSTSSACSQFAVVLLRCARVLMLVRSS